LQAVLSIISPHLVDHSGLFVVVSFWAVCCCAVQGLPSVLSGIDRSWSRDAATQPPSSPALLYTVSYLEDQLKAAYKLVTEGKFSDALKVFIRMLQIVPLMVVDSRKEVDEVRLPPP
jgi:hypothetical protein